MSDVPTYTLERVFDAPRELVWKAWTDPEYLARWYGPGVETVIHGFDLTPGGAWLNEMKFGDNSNFQRMDFLEVEPPSRLVWNHASANADWQVAANPMMPEWPKVLLTTVSFEPDGEGTKVTFTQVPVDASQAEIACFSEMMRGMDGGWGKGFEIVDAILAELSSN